MGLKHGTVARSKSHHPLERLHVKPVPPVPHFAELEDPVEATSRMVTTVVEEVGVLADPEDQAAAAHRGAPA